MQKVILVTGGNRGIGLEICRQLADEGHVVILGSRDLDKGIAVANQLDGDVYPVELDVNDTEKINNLFTDISEKTGHLDVLINNAGIMHSDTTLNVNIEDVKAVMETNVYGPWRMIQAMEPLLKKSDDPRIINVSSEMGALSSQLPDHAAYRLSKFTLNGLTLQLSKELPKMKINAMHPGWIKTDMGGSSAPGEVEEGAETAVWLATADDIPSGKFLYKRAAISW